MTKPSTRRTIRLGAIAHARSGDKGSSANVGVIAGTTEGFAFLRRFLTAARVEKFFKPFGVGKVVRYELPNLGAFNFVLPGVLAGGASRSLRIDAQGKALGQAVLEMPLKIPAKDLTRYQTVRKKSHEFFLNCNATTGARHHACDPEPSRQAQRAQLRPHGGMRVHL